MTWYKKGEDPFTKVGLCRLIVVRHEAEYRHSGRTENCTHIVFTQTFDLSFSCPDIKDKHKSGPCPSWLDDEVDSCSRKINHLFVPLANGIYELTGEIYTWCVRGYEGDWDGDTELRDVKIREVCFNHAISLCDSDEGLYEELSQLFPRNDLGYKNYHESYDIHPYQTKQQILVNHANALSYLITDNYGAYSTSYKDSSIEDLENNIYMLQMQIETERKDKNDQALEIDGKVSYCLRRHRIMMESEE